MEKSAIKSFIFLSNKDTQVQKVSVTCPRPHNWRQSQLYHLALLAQVTTLCSILIALAKWKMDLKTALKMLFALD